MVLATSTVAEVDDAFRDLMRIKSIEVGFAKALKDLQDASALVVDFVARPEVRDSLDRECVGEVERIAQDILTNTALLKRHCDAE